MELIARYLDAVASDGMPMDDAANDITVEDNFYTLLGLPLGAPVEAVEDAFVRLDTEARASGDDERSASLEKARHTLSNSGPRSLHNQRIKWAAAADWYEQTYPGGRSVEEHARWAEFRRQAIDADETVWERFKDLFVDEG